MQVSGEAAPALEFFLSSKFALSLLLLRSLTFFIGALALTAITKEHGTGAATAVGTARKSCTVLLSFLIFPKPFHVNYVIGTIAFIAADIIYLQVSSVRLARNKISEGELGELAGDMALSPKSDGSTKVSSEALSSATSGPRMRTDVA